MNVIYHREAEAELIQAAKYYDAKQTGLGADFLDNADLAVANILKNPLTYPVVDGDLRRYPMERFPYCFYFRIEGGDIRILVIKHHSRHPDYWKDRR